MDGGCRSSNACCLSSLAVDGELDPVRLRRDLVMLDKRLVSLYVNKTSKTLD